MNEIQYLQDYYKKFPSRHSFPTHGGEEPVEAHPYSPEPASTYEAEHGMPYIASKLQLSNYHVDPQNEIKVMAVDQHIKTLMEEEGLRDSVVSYETILNRMFSRLGGSAESLVRTGKGSNLLDMLFQEVALTQNMSGETFLKTVQQLFHRAKVELLKGELKKELTLLLNV